MKKNNGTIRRYGERDSVLETNILQWVFEHPPMSCTFSADMAGAT